MFSKKAITIMNFSNVYNVENMIQMNQKFKVHYLDMTKLSGTNCYCDEDAYNAIREKIDDTMLPGIHFIDSGNYHYLTRIWEDLVKVPFQLIVFDHHTDMQLPAFGGILSCGGWIADSIESLDNLQRVILLGPPEQDYEQVEKCFQEKTYYRSENEMMFWGDAAEEILDKNLPIYISIDKDILCTKDAQTNWSQGELELSDLLNQLRSIISFAKKNEQPVLAIDICGECSAEDRKYQDLNEKANQKLTDLLTDLLHEEFYCEI
ncbi:MAG: arginase [Eubacteriales bacterium]|nr:arginase [Eubacteriales bacterium]